MKHKFRRNSLHQERIDWLKRQLVQAQIAAVSPNTKPTTREFLWTCAQEYAVELREARLRR